MGGPSGGALAGAAVDRRLRRSWRCDVKVGSCEGYCMPHRTLVPVAGRPRTDNATVSGCPSDVAWRTVPPDRWHARLTVGRGELWTRIRLLPSAQL